MTDITLDRYLIWGTDADRLAFTPSPGVGGTGTNILPIWVVSDVAGLPWYFWDTASSSWQPISAGTSSSSRQLWQYKAKTGATSGYPGDGFMLWNNATQTSATDLLFSHITADGLDIDLFLAFLAVGDTIIVQDATASQNNQNWSISGSPVNTNPGTSTSYWTVPVTLNSSAGTGTSGFTNNTRLVVAVFPASASVGTVTHTGALTSGQLVIGNGSADITVGNLSGDVTTSGSAATTIANNAVTTAKINNSAVTLAKIANAAANSKLLGSGAAGSGAAYTELTLGTNLSMSGTTLNATGGGGTPGGSSGDIQYNNAGAFGGFTMSGDVTVVTSTGVSTIGALKIATGMIQANAVTLAKLATQADQTVLANTSGGSAVPSAVTRSAIADRCLISEVITSGSQTSVSFTSIPTTYRDLEVVVRARGTNASATVDIAAQFNGDSGSNYDTFLTSTVNTVTTSFAFAAQVSSYLGTIPGASASANLSGYVRAEIANYRDTTLQKTGRGWSVGINNTATTGFRKDDAGWNWRSTTAINRVDLLVSAGGFLNGSVVSLYGRF